MQFSTALLVSLLTLTPTALAVTASYDPAYDVTTASTSTLACSDGSNGLASKYPTLGSFPRFPYIAAAAAVGGWNAASCGACFKLWYAGSQKSIYVTAVDHADAGFVLSKGAMDALTGNKAAEVGRIEVASREVSKTNCGM
ncbi:immunomodulatory protein [Geopyxis carbonaria]|nr:immunomodulatory protein [Geopyxis carbonaria]